MNLEKKLRRFIKNDKLLCRKREVEVIDILCNFNVYN